MEGKTSWFPVNHSYVHSLTHKLAMGRRFWTHLPPLIPTETCPHLHVLWLVMPVRQASSMTHSPASSIPTATTLDQHDHLLLQFWQHCLTPLTVYHLGLHPYSTQRATHRQRADPLTPKGVQQLPTLFWMSPDPTAWQSRPPWPASSPPLWSLCSNSPLCILPLSHHEQAVSSPPVYTFWPSLRYHLFPEVLTDSLTWVRSS